jgi:hypothetical protein
MAGKHIHVHLHRTGDGGPGSGPKKTGARVIKPVSSTSEEQQHQERIKTAHGMGVEPEHMYPKHQRRAGDPRLTDDGGPGSGPQKGGVVSHSNASTRQQEREAEAEAENEEEHRREENIYQAMRKNIAAKKAAQTRK